MLPLEHGFAAPDLAVVTEQDILGDRLTRPQKKRRKSEQFIAEVSALAAGDSSSTRTTASAAMRGWRR